MLIEAIIHTFHSLLMARMHPQSRLITCSKTAGWGRLATWLRV